MSGNKKYPYTPFKKHYLIPIILSLTIAIAGLIMTLSDQTDLASFKSRGNNRESFILTGPATMIFGTVLTAFFIYIKRFLK